MLLLKWQTMASGKGPRIYKYVDELCGVPELVREYLRYKYFRRKEEFPIPTQH